LLALLGAAAAAASKGATAEVATTSTPVEKVVHLLEQLKEKLIADEKEDERLYNKFACWCEKQSKKKADEIEAAQFKLRALGQLILTYKGKITSWKIIVAELGAKLTVEMEAIGKLTAIRKTENGDYALTTDELMQALAALEKAIITLHEATSLIQDSSASAAKLEKAVSGVRKAVAAMPEHSPLSPEKETQLSAFLQAGGSSPQSATIQGILKDMYDTMAEELEKRMTDEGDHNTKYEALVYIKYTEVFDKKAEIAKYQKEIAEYEILLADAQLLFAETEKEMKADIEFFDMLKKMCLDKYEEWMIRKKQYAEELDGIAEALKILTSDESRELFATSIKPGMEQSFLQVSSTGGEGSADASAYRALKLAATRTHSLRLAALAATVKEAAVGHFDEVIKDIDQMIQVLKDEQADDITKRDECKQEYHEVASNVAQLDWEIEKNLAKIAKLEKLIAKREDSKAEALATIEATEKEIVEMEDQRKAEHAAFLAAKAADESAIELLTQAKAALTKYYTDNKIKLGKVQESIKAALVQKQPGSPEFEISEEQAPDANFQKKDHTKQQSKGIVSILTMIIEDLGSEIKHSIADEVATQTEHEASVATAKKLIAELEDKVKQLNEIIATRKEEMTEEHELMDDNNESLQSEHKHKKEITPDCDWILNAFAGRAEKRAAEMEGLTAAKEFLAGAAPPSMLQRGKASFLQPRK